EELQGPVEGARHKMAVAIPPPSHSPHLAPNIGELFGERQLAPLSGEFPMAADTSSLDESSYASLIISALASPLEASVSARTAGPPPPRGGGDRGGLGVGARAPGWGGPRAGGVGRGEARMTPGR